MRQKNYRDIKDRETDIPAKLQIWGKNAPESEVMDLIIKGRDHSSWVNPKKPFAIKFNEAQPILGMPKAKKWVLLANFIDRTLIRNALAFEIARHTSQKWVPQGRFVDVFLNKEYIGNYYLCEKIQVKQNRINPITTTYLLELDLNYDEEYKFKTAYKNLPINIKYPDKPTILQFNHIHNHLDSIECALYSTCKDFNVLSKKI